jgi:NAD(P)-dependent dehydrogenase (short-subunit alcohol dehydrogenase family)
MADPLAQFSLQGRVAIVTGATEGIGRGLAVGLAEAGADVVVCARREDALREIQGEIARTGRRGEACPLDVCRTADIERLRDFTLQRFGKVDILVNAAGFTVTKPAWETTEDEWDRMVDTGFKGLFFCCQIVGGAMRARGYGKIINLSSTFSRSIIKGRSVYGGIKAGVTHLTEALAMEWAPDGIRVNALAPTAVLTPSRASLLQGEVLERILARIPLGRLATPADLTGAAVYLASAASDFVTGQTLFVDGGWVAAS